MKRLRSSLIFVTAWLHCESGCSFLLHSSTNAWTINPRTSRHKPSPLCVSVHQLPVEKRTSKHEKDATDGTNSRKGVTVEEFPYCVSIPASSSSNINNNNIGWIHQAALYLREHGVCVLTTHADNGGAVVDPFYCESAEEAAMGRLSCLQDLIRDEHGMGSGGPFRFREVVSRDESGGRYDMPVPWQPSNHNNDDGEEKDTSKMEQVPLTQSQSKAISNFHFSLEQTVQPIMDILWVTNTTATDNNTDSKDKDKQPNENVVTASGFLINQPGSTDQTWHRDGPMEGWINVFCPLVDLTMDLGPTEVWPNTHLSSSSSQPMMAPLLKRGQVLLMDYRTFHRGLGNYCDNNLQGQSTRTVAYAVYNRGASASLGDKLSYGLLPRAYPSVLPVFNNKPSMISSSDNGRGIHVPIDENDDANDNSWVHKAIFLLQQEGVCVLDQSSLSGDSLTTTKRDEVGQQILQRLEDLLQRVRNRGVEPDENDEPFDFLEISCQAPGHYNLPTSTTSDNNLPPWEAQFHSQLQDSVRPILNKMWENNNYHLASSGFRIHQPGSAAQQWHRDDCDPGSIHVICPLSTSGLSSGLVETSGSKRSPIEVWPRSHDAAAIQKDDTAAAMPVLPAWRQGRLILMDRRMLYQYLENTPSSSDRDGESWVWGYSVWRKGMAPPKGHVRPGAMTLEYD